RPHHADGMPIAGVRVAELSDNDVRRLVALLARSGGLDLLPEQIGALASTTRGYPPSARFAVDLAAYYGPAVAGSDASRAVEYRIRPFRAYLRSLVLTHSARTLLRILTGNSPLPLEVLQAVAALNSEEVGAALMQLIDTSLVTPTAGGWYRVVGPVIETVE